MKLNMGNDNPKHMDHAQEPRPEEQQDFGSWMMVKKPPPRRRTTRAQPPSTTAGKEVMGQNIRAKNPNQQGPKEKAGGSRFEILNEQVI